VLRGPGQPATNISNSPGYDGKPTWSPDGRLIAFESDRNGNRDIFIVGPDGSGLKQITSSPANEAFSPIDYSYSNTGLIHLLNVWSPDGNSLLVHTDRSGDWNAELIDVESGAATKLLLGQALALAIWSPDGSQIAFLAKGNTNNQPPVEVINIDGTNRRVLSKGDALDGDLYWGQAHPLAWSTDGQFLYIDYGTGGGNSSIAKVAANGQEKPKELRSSYVPTEGFRNEAWLDGENRLYYIVSQALVEHPSYSWLKQENGKVFSVTEWNPQQLCEAPKNSNTGYQDSWGISHQGTQALLALSCPDKEKSELYHLDLGSGLLKKIAEYDDVWISAEFSWSADDQFALARIQNAATGQVELIQIRADTLQTTRLWSGEWNEENIPRLQPAPYWPETSQPELPPGAEAVTASPSWNGENNGDLIAFLSGRNGAYDIFLLKSDGSGSPVNLSNSPEFEADLSWSPDGQWLAFTRSLTGGAPWGFYIMRPDGSQLTQLESGSDWFSVSWSPDSQKIGLLVESWLDEQTNFQIKIIDTAGETILQSMELSSRPNSSIKQLDWSIDGKWLYYIENKYDPNTWESLYSTLYKIQLENPTPIAVIQSETPLDGWMETNGNLYYLQRTTNGWDLMLLTDGTASRKASWEFDPKQCDIPLYLYNWQDNANQAIFTWSPDRRQILIRQYCETGRYRFYLGNIDGTLFPVLNYPLNSSFEAIPAWSPDGKSVVLDADLETPGTQHLYLLDLAAALVDPSTRPVRITQSGFDEHSPVWQPAP
jgi:Tol biopolymer transport system component